MANNENKSTLMHDAIMLFVITIIASFVVILSVIRAVVFTYEIGLSIEPPFAILTRCV